VSNTWMPVEPFAELIERRIQVKAVPGLDPEDKDAYSSEGLTTPLEQITQDIADRLFVSYDTAARRVYDIRYHKTKRVSFHIADAIACSCGGGLVFWRTDERVNALYEGMAA